MNSLAQSNQCKVHINLNFNITQKLLYGKKIENLNYKIHIQRHFTSVFVKSLKLKWLLFILTNTNTILIYTNLFEQEILQVILMS